MILLVAHDAGGAEIVSSWALRQNEELSFALGGPAKVIFERKLQKSLPGAMGEDPDFVLCGTGVTGFERDYISRALDKRTRCAAWLDHWKRYRERFEALPDEIWVTDQWAAQLASYELPEANILVKGNPYVEDVLADIRRLDEHREEDALERILYVHEPGRERNYQRWVSKSFRKGQYLRERPHPSQTVPANSLAEDISWADTVIGCDSMALGVAVRAKRRTLSILPKGEKLNIPYPGIERLYQ